MIVALIDNGSLEAAAHRELRSIARALGRETQMSVHAVSWKHSHRIPETELDGTPAWTLSPFVRSLVALGQREFVFVPLFISPQGAIGTALRRDLESLQNELGAFEFTFTAGLADRGVLPEIVADQIRTTLRTMEVRPAPPVIVVDHGGPSAVSAELRNRIAAQVGDRLEGSVGQVLAASMEGGDHPHNRPLLADALAQPGFDRGPAIIAPLFLLPGRHAGPAGDLAQIARAAESRQLRRGLRCHFTPLIGSHPRVVTALADALRATLSTLHSPTLP